MLTVTAGTYTCEFKIWRPEDGQVFDFFAIDTETTEIDDERPYITPTIVVATACDGKRGFIIPREHLVAFLKAHQGVPRMMHNAAFDLNVMDAQARPHM